jgi:hypothetical protein
MINNPTYFKLPWTIFQSNVGDPVIKSGRVSVIINLYNPVILFCLSQARTWISNVTGRGFFIYSVAMLHLYRRSLFYWWRKPEYPEKTTDLPKSLTNVMLYRVNLTMSRIQTHNVSICKIFYTWVTLRMRFLLLFFTSISLANRSSGFSRKCIYKGQIYTEFSRDNL